MKWLIVVLAIWLGPPPLLPQAQPRASGKVANSQASPEVVLGGRVAHEYEKQAGLGSTPEVAGISGYISNVGNRVAHATRSRFHYHFVFDPNPAFKSAFALPGGYIIVGGGLLALAQTEDELANALAHEIEHVELG